MSLLEVNKITPQSGTTLTLGDTGDTINFGSGVLPNFENLTVTGDLTVDTNSLYVDSTNNFVGIGTASPSVALDVVGAITATGNLTVDTNTLIVDSTNNNVGIGKTPDASYSNYKALEIGNAGFLTSIGSGNENIFVGSNAYLNGSGSWTYMTTNEATYYRQGDGRHSWNYAPSGTADTAITFNEAMRINSAGDFMVGTTSEVLSDSTGTGTYLDISKGTLQIKASGNIPLVANRVDSDGQIIQFRKDGTTVGSIGSISGAYLYMDTPTANFFKINGTNEVAIASAKMYSPTDGRTDLGSSSERFKDLYLSGNAYASIVNINNASAQGRLNVSNNGAEQLEVFPGDVSGKVSLQAFNRSDTTYDSFRYIGLTHEFLISGTEKMRIDSSGNVGIGTTSPTSGGGLTLSSSTTAQGFIDFKHTVDGDSGFIGNAKALITGATTNQLGVRGGTNGIAFGVGATEAMRIDSSGQVGIGTTSPQQLLHLKSNNPGGKIRLEMGQAGVANNDVTGEIQFYHNDASGAGINADIKGICTNSIGAGALIFGTGTTSTSERMRIDTSGNLLVGTTSQWANNSTGIVLHPIGTHGVTNSFSTAWSIPDNVSGLLFVQGDNSGQYGGVSLFMLNKISGFNATITQISGFAGDISGYGSSWQLSGSNAFQLKHTVPGQTINYKLKFIAM